MIGALLLEERERDPHQRDARPEQPGEQQAAAHAGRARGHLGEDLTKSGDHLAHAVLEEQECDRAGGQSAEQHGEHATEDEERLDAEHQRQQQAHHDGPAEPVGSGVSGVPPLVAEH